MAGYSRKTLVEKLGIKENITMVLMNEPDYYRALLGKLPSNVVVKNDLNGPLDFIHFFTVDRGELEQKFPLLKKSLTKDGMIWISWPKIKSNIKTDLQEGIVREIGLCNGMVDIKVCAIDDKWSGLKFVFRLKDRK